MFTDLVDLKKLDLKREEKPRNDSESHPQQAQEWLHWVPIKTGKKRLKTEEFNEFLSIK